MFLEWGEFNIIEVGDHFHMEWEGFKRVATITGISTSVSNSMKGERPEVGYDINISSGEQSFMMHKKLIATLTGEK